MVGDRPAQDYTAERVQGRVAVDLAVRCAVLCDVGEPARIRYVGGELPLGQDVWGGQVDAVPPPVEVGMPWAPA